MKPYTYLIKHIPSNRCYYGVRTAIGCDPSDLWKTYFTSSEKVKGLIKRYGKKSFSYEVRKTFDTPEQAREWESKVITRIKAIRRKDFLNQANGMPMSWWLGKKLSKNHKIKVSKSLINNKRCLGIKNRLGKKHSEKTKIKLSESMKGRIPWNKGKSYSINCKNKTTTKSNSWLV
jgi:hypothetical protein